MPLVPYSTVYYIYDMFKFLVLLRYPLRSEHLERSRGYESISFKVVVPSLYTTVRRN